MKEDSPGLSRSLTVTIALLYVAEGLPFGIINDLVPVWLRLEGISLTEIGLLNLVGLPWTLKVLWAPVVDRHGAASSWIMAALATVALLLLLLPLVAGSLVGLGALLLLMAAASATQDVAIDGYTATAVPPRLHGRANGLRVAAYRAALVASGGGAVALAPFLGWPAVFSVMALLCLGLILWARRLPPIERAPPEPLGRWLGELWAWLSKDGIPMVLGFVSFVLLFKLGDAAMGPMVKPFWIDMGLQEAEVGLLTTMGLFLTAGGALVGGELTTRLGLFRALWVLGAVQALSNLCYAGAALDPQRPAIYAASIVESFTSGLGTAAYLAFLMRLCEARQAATRFALLTALAGLTRTLAGVPSGLITTDWGYAPYFAFTFLLALPAFALLPVVRRRIGSADPLSPGGTAAG